MPTKDSTPQQGKGKPQLVKGTSRVPAPPTKPPVPLGPKMPSKPYVPPVKLRAESSENSGTPEGVQLPSPKVLDPERFENQAGGALPLGMEFPSVGEFEAVIGAVGAEQEGKGRQEGDEEEESPTIFDNTKNQDSASGESGCTEAASAEPEVVESADVAELMEAIVRSREDPEAHDAESLCSEDVPEPSDVLVVTGEIKRVEARLEGVSAELAKTLQLVSSLHEVVGSLRSDNAALTSAVSALQAEVHRSRHLEASISAQDARAKERLEATLALAEQEESSPSIKQIREQLAGISPGDVATAKASSSSETRSKPLLFRDY